MKIDDLKYIIDLYIDGELEKGKEPFLFTALSQDGEAREYFKAVNYLKNNIQQNSEPYPSSLDKRVLRSIGNSTTKQPALFTNKNIYLFLACSAAAVFIFISALFYGRSEDYKRQSEDYKEQFFTLSREVKKQNSDLQLILNAMPEIQVKSGYFRTKEIVVKANL